MASPPAERSARARIAALARWSEADYFERQRGTAAAREAFAKKFMDRANPQAALRAHMARLALASAKKRREA